MSSSYGRRCFVGYLDRVLGVLAEDAAARCQGPLCRAFRYLFLLRGRAFVAYVIQRWSFYSVREMVISVKKDDQYAFSLFYRQHFCLI